VLNKDFQRLTQRVAEYASDLAAFGDSAAWLERQGGAHGNHVKLATPWVSRPRLRAVMHAEWRLP
jgi:hypothetical protein